MRSNMEVQKTQAGYCCASERSDVKMKNLRAFPLVSFVAFVSFVSIQAQQPQPPEPQFDPAAVERGQQLLASQCGFCHGSTGRGAASGPDLTRSELVQSDDNGKQLGEFLAVGRPDRGMPRFDLSPAQVSDLAIFLHRAIYFASNRRLYKILDILVGDKQAGEAYFKGAGRCGTCHSPAGNLKGVGAKYDPVTLQGRLLLPRGRPPNPGGPPPPPLYTEPTAMQVSVTPASGETASGALVRLTDFEVTLYEKSSGRMRSWLRNGDVPKVVVTDPLQAHVDQLPKWTDADMHNMTAYLASLK
jgi:cytochrome c oxidase cbb3-type subunit 3